MSDDQPYTKDDEKRTNATMIRGTTHGGGSVHGEGTDGSEVSSSVAKKLDSTATDIVERLLPVPDRLAKEALDEIKKLREALKNALDQRDLLAVKVSQWEASYVLTAEERESLQAAVGIIDRYEEDMDGFPSGAAATLRNLLERTK